jgi:flagellar biosynthesis/type III secretory pathway chaperone
VVNLTQSTIAGNNWEELLEMLRTELQEYGGLIGLLNAQQQSILNRKPDSLVELNQSVRAQMEASQILQKRRQGYVSHLAKNFGKPEQSTLSELLPHLPDVTQPMFESIIEEINSLISNVRRKVSQNQRLLSRLLEVTDHILSIANPTANPVTYSKQGKVGVYSSTQINLSGRA